MIDHPKLPRRLARIFTNNPLLFVTFCTHQHGDILATNSVNAAFIEFAIRAHAEHNVAVGRYVIMPDHSHLFVCGPDDFRLGDWIGMLKRHLAGAIRPIEASRPIWQRGFFDHLLRSEESYGQKWNYVRENPVRARLVARVEDWPFACEIVIIDRV